MSPTIDIVSQTLQVSIGIYNLSTVKYCHFSCFLIFLFIFLIVLLEPCFFVLKYFINIYFYSCQCTSCISIFVQWFRFVLIKCASAEIFSKSSFQYLLRLVCHRQLIVGFSGGFMGHCRGHFSDSRAKVESCDVPSSWGGQWCSYDLWYFESTANLVSEVLSAASLFRRIVIDT